MILTPFSRESAAAEAAVLLDGSRYFQVSKAVRGSRCCRCLVRLGEADARTALSVWRYEMTEKRKRTGRTQVRAENPSGACGNVDHMTIDELKARAVGENFDGSCPACGMFHLSRADIDRIVAEKISETERYTEMKREAEQG